jgi:hypothetical protein
MGTRSPYKNALTLVARGTSMASLTGLLPTAPSNFKRLQAFYWDCPRSESQEGQWWNHIRNYIPALSATGFTALWLLPVSKAANIGGMSMRFRQ